MNAVAERPIEPIPHLSQGACANPQGLRSAGLPAGCSVGLPTHAGRRLLRPSVCKRHGGTGFCSGGEDAAGTADQEVGATGGELAGRNPGCGAGCIRQVPLCCDTGGIGLVRLSVRPEHLELIESARSNRSAR